MTKKFARCLMMTVVMIVCLMANCFSAAAAETYTIPVTVKYGQTEARSMLSAINKFRTGSEAWYYTDDTMTTKKSVTGLKALEYDYGLEQIAMQRAAEIALYFDHSRPDGSFCFDVTTSTGYSSNAENIAGGYSSASSVFEGWLEEYNGYSGQGHRRNMLGSYTHVGIAHVYFNGYHYWVQEFGYKSTGVSKTAANDSEKTINIDVSTDKIWYNYVEDAPSSLTLSLGKTTKVPTVTMMFGTYIQLSGYYRHTVTPNWTVSGSAVSISGGNITAKSIGSATLTATIYGNKVTVKVTVECTDHKWGSWSTTKDATCTDNGSQTRKCSLCGKKETKSVAAKGHSFGSYKETKAATCTEDGSEQRKCSVCNKTETRKIAAKGHKWSAYKVVKAATSDSEGIEERSCSVCKATEQRKIAKLPAQTTTTVTTKPPAETKPPETTTSPDETTSQGDVTEPADSQPDVPVDSSLPDDSEPAEDSSEDDKSAPDAVPPDAVASDSDTASVDDTSSENEPAADISATDLTSANDTAEQDTLAAVDAQTDDSDDFPMLYVILGGSGAVLVLGIIIFFAVRRKKND